MRGLTEPLLKLQNAIRKLGNIGESDSKLLLQDGFKAELKDIKESGEIGSLKRAFQSMSERLESTMRSLHKLAEDWENTFDSVIDVIFLLDKDNNITRLNKAGRDLIDKPYQELMDKPITAFLNIPSENILSAPVNSTGEDESFNIHVNDNQVYEIFCNSLVDEQGNIVGKVLVGRDITSRLEAGKERLRLEERLQKAHKMEAIGTLAGGVAHDLNNILSGIVSYPELLLMQLPKDSPLVKPIETILQSGKKATAIVQDLLTLARRGAETFEVLNLNTIVDEYLKSPEFIKLKSFHPKVAVTADLAHDLLNIEGSAVHLSKAIMNLVSNAAEAMPQGGNIQIATENRYVDTKIIAHEDITEGDYVVLTVADEGLGIAPDDFDRIFEPFYTKKKMGHSGTGLGMSVVWGTVRDHNGLIDLKSDIGLGTTFKIYFPVTRKIVQQSKNTLDIEDLYGNNESILVVDDVEAQRVIATSILTQLGYSVTSVASGEEALAYLKDHSVDLLVLDMIMAPGINGLETYRKALEIAPEQKAIITSGYSETDSVKQAQAIGAGQYVKKPYTIDKIGMAVKKELYKGQAIR
jgi:signal transduction histidine kinase/ActR/RegA family two-component response regulator